MKINFDSIEARLKSLVESSVHLIGGKAAEDPRTARLISAVQVYLDKKALSDETILPDNLICEVPVTSLKSWRGYPLQEMTAAILREKGQPGISGLKVSLVSNPDLLDGEVFMRDTDPGTYRLDRTASMPILTSAEEGFLGDTIPGNAFLIVNGIDTVPLDQPVVNIGRKLENDLVIEDPRISREHAQIRAMKGQYVIFDLDSTGGTFVNSVRVTRQPLYPGDVISLSGVPLVYGQDTPLANTQTGPVEPFFTPPPEKGAK